MSTPALRRLSALLPSRLPRRSSLPPTLTPPHFRNSALPIFSRLPLRWVTTSSSHSSPLPTQSERHLHSAVLPSFSLLTFPELTSYATSFLTDFYTKPSHDSHNTALALLSSLTSLTPQSPVQQGLQVRLVGALTELLHETTGKVEVKDRGEDAEDAMDRVVTVGASAVVQEVGVMDLHVEELKGEGEQMDAAVKFADHYSVDQMLVDSLPTLEREEVVQLGRRHVSHILGN